MNLCFEGKPELETICCAVAEQEVAGVYVRVRWSIAEKDRHEVDREATARLLAGADETTLEGGSCR
ncbi:hypothetical protein HFK18_13240|uniref:hypothetical protein n=1 Tax=Stenotrophomonas sp. SbOxS2 TaxID=2723885 RepID=UPI0015D1C894|nr:hypothetical protein [Stenotrophomonas sp. SbOxS2]NYT99442.1 hypothetical protein [Stenotrophomonas sp. SbOxS2]